MKNWTLASEEYFDKDNRRSEPISLSQIRLLSEHETLKPQTQNHETPNPNLFIHETAIIDDPYTIGAGTKIRHFTHIMSGSKLGAHCNIGQNVVVSPEVILGNYVKVQNKDV